MSDFFRPKLQAVEALAPYRLRTSWSTGEVLDVDIEPVLRGIPALAGVALRHRQGLKKAYYDFPQVLPDLYEGAVR